MNFGMTYGQTPYGLAREFGMSVHEAESVLAAHAASYPSAAAWIAEIHEQASVTGEVRTLFGRRRYLPSIHAANPAMVSESRRKATGSPDHRRGENNHWVHESICPPEKRPYAQVGERKTKFVSLCTGQ